MKPEEDADRPTAEALRFWVETRLRDALEDPENIEHALAMLKVGHDAGDPVRVVVKKVLADFVFGALGVPVQ